MHGLKPIRIFKRLKYLLGFNTRNKRIMGIKVSQLITSCYPFLDASKHLIHREILRLQPGCNLECSTCSFFLHGLLRWIERNDFGRGSINKDLLNLLSLSLNMNLILVIIGCDTLNIEVILTLILFGNERDFILFLVGLLILRR